MPRWTDCAGLAGLGALALLTAAINVQATRHSYVIGSAVRESDDLERIISYHRASCRQMLRTEVVAKSVRDLGLTEEDLYPTVPRFNWETPVAIGSER